MCVSLYRVSQKSSKLLKNVLLEFECLSTKLNAKMRKILTGCIYYKYWPINKLKYLCKAHNFLCLCRQVSQNRQASILICPATKRSIERLVKFKTLFSNLFEEALYCIFRSFFLVKVIISLSVVVCSLYLWNLWNYYA
jgi:hypothetical protein